MKRFIVIIGLLVSLGVMAGEKRDHYYAVKDGYKYGYEVAGSPELVLIEYLGQKKGVHQVLVTEGENRTVFQSESGGRYATSFEYWRREFQNRSMMKLEENSIISQVMLDAWNGRLIQFKNESGNTLWIDGENGPVWSGKGH